MELFIIFRESVFPIFVIIIIAVIFHKIFKPDTAQISNLALYAFAPVFVFNSLIGHRISLIDFAQPALFMLVLTIALLVLGYGISVLLKLRGGEKTSFILACSMMNVGNFGLPLIYFAYGEEAIAYSVIFFIVFNIPLTTLAIYLSSNKASIREALADIFKIPILYAMLLALLFCFWQIQLPASLNKGIELFSEGTIPLFIVVAGLQLSNISLKWAKRFILVIMAGVIIRLLASPLLALPITTLLGMSGVEQSIAIVQTSTPSAILPLIYAIRFNKSPELLASIIFFTTLISGITLPGVINWI